MPYYRYVAPESSNGACPQPPRGHGRADGDNAACLAHAGYTITADALLARSLHQQHQEARQVAREELTAVA